jgi:glycosyltransferase involved in cell wall biosynthesis
MVLLLGNYQPDQQESMQRFSAMMLRGLTARGIETKLIAPQVIFGNVGFLGAFAKKWLGYVDKFVLFPFQLRKGIQKWSNVIVHICDHSNAVYVNRCRPVPVMVTCHDLLAVRGGLGEDTDCPATFTGRLLQRWILRGLDRAEAIACVSSATAADASRLLSLSHSELITVVSLGLSYDYKQVPIDDARLRLAPFHSLDLERPFVLHVGSNLRRKNRDGVLRIIGRVKEQWSGQVVFAGDPLTRELRRLAEKLGIADRVVEIPGPANEVLEALYTSAVALLYPSRFEGFGWPVIEAQACGCPVICSDAGPLPEIAGDAGLFHSLDDEDGFASDLLRLSDSAERIRWSDKSLINVKRFSTLHMIDEYIGIYRRLGVNL